MVHDQRNGRGPKGIGGIIFWVGGIQFCGGGQKREGGIQQEGSQKFRHEAIGGGSPVHTFLSSSEKSSS